MEKHELLRANEYKEFRIMSYHVSLEKYRLGLKCRSKWLRRRGVKSGNSDTDQTYIYLNEKVNLYYNILSKLLGKKYVSLRKLINKGYYD